MADDHRVVLISILSTLIAALIIFVTTVAISGGVALDLVRAYVLPLVISAFTLGVFWFVLFFTNKIGFLRQQQ